MSTPISSYDQQFFASMPADNASARIALSMMRQLMSKQPPRSVVDVGCGTGSWLAAARDIWPSITATGIDGDYVPRHLLAFPVEAFVPHDLEQPLPRGARYDLAICCEVAEHLSHERAATFVADLCALSDVIVFSAALPFQGGTRHINEQWAEYWGILFRAAGYRPHDVLRHHATAFGDQVEYYFRGNLLVFARSGGDFDRQQHVPFTPPHLTRIDPMFLLHAINKRWPHMHGTEWEHEVAAYHALLAAWQRGDVTIPAGGIAAPQHQTVRAGHETAAIAPRGNGVNRRLWRYVAESGCEVVPLRPAGQERTP